MLASSPRKGPGDQPILELWDFDFSGSSTHGLMAGSTGLQDAYLFQTTDGGQTWTQERCFDVAPGATDCTWPTTYGVARVGTWPEGLAAGDSGFLAYSTDFGGTWSPGTGGGGATFHAVAFLPGTDDVLAGGVGGTLRKSTDGGATWSAPIAVGTAETITAIDFADANVGYLVGSNEIAFRTTNGGLDWVPVETVDNDGGTTTFYGVATWGDGTAAFAVGSDGRMYQKTANRFIKQQNQVPSDFPSDTDLTDVEAFAEGADVRLRIAGAWGLMLFRDGGVWTTPKSQTNERHTALSFLSPDEGWGIGRPFLVTKYE